MKKKLTLYHGSRDMITQPQFGLGREHNDFGRGFYCTESPDLAKEWACTPAHNGFANKYLLDTSGLMILNLNTPEFTILHWMALLVNHRVFRIRNPIAGRAKKYLTTNYLINVSAYDAIIGYRADDSYYDFADAFLNNAITVEQLALAMRLGKLGEQFVLKSLTAFDRIRFDSAEVAENEIYYPKRKMRDETAALSYRKITENDADGLYMIDILRNGVKSDDPRIPRNIP
ncbi:MAG: DUF3990 domain-containing protein [Lachnospiraceae bacterium]|nr:DUF3990 domain-containing protein [Lachnospiraceae bacterium]